MLTINLVLHFSESKSGVIIWYGFTSQFASHPSSPLLEVCSKLGQLKRVVLSCIGTYEGSLLVNKAFYSFKSFFFSIQRVACR